MPGRGDADGGRARSLPWAVAVAVGVAVLAGGLVLGGVGPWGPPPVGSTSDTTDFVDDGADGTVATPSPTPATETETTPAPLPPGEPLDGTRSLGEADVVIRGSGDDELGYGAAVGDVNADGTPDVVLGAPLHTAGSPQSGAAFVFFGPVVPGTLTVEDADVRLPGEAGGDWAGNSIAVADVNADGVGDVVVGAPRNAQGGDDAGAVYVVYGGRHLGGTAPLESADAKLVGASGSFAGYSVAAANLTGGHEADLVIGAPRANGSRGTVFLVDGRDVERTSSLVDARATLVGEGAGDEAGWSVAVAGDVTGDDRGDVLVGARRNDAAGENAGAAYVAAAPFEGRTSLGAAALVLRGPGAGAMAGWSVAGPGDVDGDDRGDVLVGAPLAGSRGAAYLVRGGTGERSLADAAALRGEARGDRAGWVVAGAGDVTCDGRPDLLVGAPANDAGGNEAGAVYLVAGGEDTAGLANATAKLAGAAPGDQAGRADALAAVRGDGVTGLVVGAPFGQRPPTAHIVYAACSAG